MSNVTGVLLVLGKVVLVLVGTVAATVLIEALVSDTQLFLDPKYKSFWADVEAYHSDPNARKTDVEYIRQYGFNYTNNYMINPGAGAAFLPSEEAAKPSVKWYIITQKQRDNSRTRANDYPVIAGFIFVIVVLYLPVAYTARQVQRVVAVAVSWTSRARKARKAYFAKYSGERFFWVAIGAFVVALVLSVINSARTISPEDQARGLTVLDLAGALLYIGYFSGLWVRLVSHVIDVGFIAFGYNPHKSIWDNVLTLVVTAPVLLFVYNNSWLTVLTGAITGLATELYATWSVARQEAQKRGAEPVPNGEGAGPQRKRSR
jgi:hypothetical protein